MINLIGLEVEGGWKGTRFVPPFDIPLIADHSVDGRMMAHDRAMKSTHVGEVISKPMPCTPENVDTWINKYWPTEANNTCGYHIHLSFTKLKDYSILTRKSFLFGLIKTMNDLGKELKLEPKHSTGGERCCVNRRPSGTSSALLAGLGCGTAPTQSTQPGTQDGRTVRTLVARE